MPILDHSEVILAEPAMTDAGNGIFKKRILYEGRFLHPANPKRFFDVTPEHFADIVRNFKAKVFDRVQIYHTHSEDPRDIAGQVIGLEEGTEPSDMKKSLYVLLKPKDKATAEQMRKNDIGVSAALDNVYREHMEGQPVGTVLRHVALVGEGWIKKLGEFMPLRLADHVVYLSDDKHSAVYLGDHGTEDIEEDDDEEIDVDLKELTGGARKKLKKGQFAYVDSQGKGHLPIPDAAHVRNAISRFNQTHFEDAAAKARAKAKIRAAAQRFGVQTNFDDEERNDDMPGELKDFTLEQIISDLKSRHSIDVPLLQEHSKTALAIRQALKLADNVSLADGIAAAIKSVEDKAATDLKAEQDKTAKLTEENLKKDAEAAVASLLSENKIAPAQKDTLVKLYLKDKDLYTEMTKDLKKGAVPLGEKGKDKADPPKEGDINEVEEIDRNTAILAESGAEMRGFKNGKKDGDK